MRFEILRFSTFLNQRKFSIQLFVHHLLKIPLHGQLIVSVRMFIKKLLQKPNDLTEEVIYSITLVLNKKNEILFD